MRNLLERGRCFESNSTIPRFDYCFLTFQWVYLYYISFYTSSSSWMPLTLTVQVPTYASFKKPWGETLTKGAFRGYPCLYATIYPTNLTGKFSLVTWWGIINLENYRSNSRLTFSTVTLPLYYLVIWRVKLQLGFSKYLPKCNWETFGFYQIGYLGILNNTFEYHTKWKYAWFYCL